MECFCIIPFYNEKDRIQYVINQISKIKHITKILCINDGSDDGIKIEKLKQNNKVLLLENTENKGKSEAIKVGLQKLTSNYVLLFDGDLKNIVPHEIENAIEHMFNDQKIDMVIFQRTKLIPTAKIVNILTRRALLESGLRLMKTKDLKEVMKLNPKNFEIEMAINIYMMNNNKNVLWTPISAVNSQKFSKRGFFHGIAQDINMYWQIFTFGNLLDHVKMSLFFSRNRL